MAKIKSVSKSIGTKKKKRRAHRDQEALHRADGTTVATKDLETPEQLYSKASDLFLQLQIDKALSVAQRSLDKFLEVYPNNPRASYPTLLLLGQIYLALGDVGLSREHYFKATELSEVGGEESIKWFEKACAILRRALRELEEQHGIEEAEDAIIDTRRQLGETLCSMTEVYMTDLSFDPEAGSRCDALMTEAVLVSPDSPAVLQTLASVRISEERMDDATSALTRSMELWRHLPNDDVNIPDFATRISLARLLLEVGMEPEAVEVVDQLVQEDDQSVEALYLGAWSRYLSFEKNANTASDSRDWFRRCLRLYTSVDYEDEKLRQHVVEMITKLDEILGPPVKEEEAEEEDDEWEDEADVEYEEEIEVEEPQEDVKMNDVDMKGGVT
ncbi:hypothetical protein GJ744_003932 [Endocarpon pusillum]|uniref:Assembly chaperone of rpl4 n=1 Tax=Endocarpon pusillum TaxID=364733 RepID=A0A8H7E0C0_9EURO|nr:hypothetical protein GJ744_003932 [Endocarpon pusillum]